MSHTPGLWYWHDDSMGRLSLRTPNRGQLIVMDFVRSGMQGAAPRFAVWPGINEGAPRERLGGLMDSFYAEHPDARLIAAAPALYEALESIMADFAPLCNPQHPDMLELDECPPGDPRGCLACEVRRQATRALAAAKGENNG